jgi:hypothetical protein
MRRFLWVWVAASACAPAPECTTRFDCEDGFLCVNQACEAVAFPDAGQDAGLCACGNADVDGDGDVDEDDFSALPSAVVDPCVLAAADVDRDGDYDEDDEHLLRVFAGGLAIEECSACGACGDADADGTVDDEDAALVTAAITAAPSACTFLASDVDRDLDVDQEDAWVVAGIAAGRVTAECGRCEPERVCGDFNGDGRVSVADTSGLFAVTSDAIPIAPCVHLATDVIRDGVVDRRDAFATFRMVTYPEDPILMPCRPCPAPEGGCGDVNGDAGVSAGDIVAVQRIADMRTADDLCARSRADLNADGQVNERDVGLVSTLSVGGLTMAPRCPICSGVCGDANGDGTVTGDDAIAAGAIGGGASASICERDGADVNGDSRVDTYDQRLIDLLSMPDRIASATPCRVCTGICGDADQDGAVTEADRAIITMVAAGRPPTICELDDGDVNFNGVLDAGDDEDLTNIIAGTPPPMACGR